MRWRWQHVVFLLMLFFAKQGWTQTAEAGGESEFSLHMGRLFPAYIDGIDEIMPFWGFRHSIARSKHGYFEWGVMTARAYETEWHTLSVSLRGDVPIEYMTGIFYLGLDGHFYNKANETTMRDEGGIHVGTALLNHLAENLWFRADMKFNFGPGTQMYLGFSIVFKEPGKQEGS